VESESAKIGSLRVPAALLAAMHGHGQPVRIATADAARVALLLDDYHDRTRDPEPLCRLLDGLVELRGRERVHRWQALAREGRWAELVGALMAEHYDPLYERSMRHSYPGLEAAPRIELARGDDAELAAAARTLIAWPSP
jgi:tRNA 2-selenouridine synthase